MMPDSGFFILKVQTYSLLKCFNPHLWILKTISLNFTQFPLQAPPSSIILIWHRSIWIETNKILKIIGTTHNRTAVFMSINYPP